MQIYSIKTLVSCFAFLAMTNSAAILTAHSDCSERHQHSHSRSHSHHHNLPKCKIPIPHTSFNQFSLRVSTDFHTQNRGLDVLFTAEAFAPHPIPVVMDGSTTPATIIVTEPHVAQLIQAVNTGTAFGRNDLAVILNAFGIDAEPFVNSIEAFVLAGEQYSIAVVNNIPAAPYLTAWQEAGVENGNQLALVLGFAPGSAEFIELQGLIQNVVNDEAQGVLGLNGLLPPSALLPGETQSVAGLRFFTMSRIATTSLGQLTADQLILNYNGKPCKACERL